MGTTIDLARVRRIVTQFAQALDEPDRVVQVEQLLRGGSTAGVNSLGVTLPRWLRALITATDLATPSAPRPGTREHSVFSVIASPRGTVR